MGAAYLRFSSYSHPMCVGIPLGFAWPVLASPERQDKPGCVPSTIGGSAGTRTRKGANVAEEYEGYCVKCRTKRKFQGEKKDLPNGRMAAQGPCPVCGTKVTRMLGKSG